MTLLRALTFGGYLASLRPAHRRFTRALSSPARQQREHLLALVARNASTPFGRQHRFAGINSVAAFQAAVPVQTYEDVAPWMDRIFAGEHQALSASPIRILERTSGSTASNKLIPFTRDFLDEIGQSTSIWLYDTYRRHRQMIGGKSYYSISPAMRAVETSPGGIRIGMEDDRDYLGFVGRHLVGSLMAVPPTVAHIPDPLAWRRETLFHLLECADLRFVSIWSPTFLQALVDHLQERDPVLEARLTEDARRRLSAARSEGLALRSLWPRLAVISLWMDGPSVDFARQLSERTQGIELQPKALMATEGVVSQPYGRGEGAPLAVTTHFLEFLHLPSREVRLAHELRVGERYSPILTTGAGLYRYHLKDIVECVGFEGLVPRIRFVGKLEIVSDLCGEKVSSDQALIALHAADAANEGRTLRWKQLLPRADPYPHYVLLVDGDPAQSGAGGDASLLEAAERSLRGNLHYEYARNVGQLRPLRVVRVKGAGDLYTQWSQARGVRLGDIKFQPLVVDPAFPDFLAAHGPAGTAGELSSSVPS